jgi:hypothetical protein
MLNMLNVDKFFTPFFYCFGSYKCYLTNYLNYIHDLNEKI